MLGRLIGDMMIAGVLAAIGLALWAAWWLLGGGLLAWDRERKERAALAEAEETEAERSQEWDAARAAELAAWLRQGILPSPISRLYPAYQEFTWEWARLQEHGYQLDHDPVLLEDGQLMVTYSRRSSRQSGLRIAK